MHYESKQGSIGVLEITEPKDDEDTFQIKNRPEHIAFVLLVAVVIAVLGSALSRALFVRP